MRSALQKLFRSLLPAALLAAFFASGCILHFPDDELPYICAEDKDCGGGSYICETGPTGGYCCNPDAEDEAVD